MFDLVFIDAVKRRTRDFFELTYPKVRTHGTIIVDDVVKYADKMADFYELLET